MKSSELIEWEVAVDQETRRLIAQGIPPWPAAEQAVRNVRAARRRAQATIPTADDVLNMDKKATECRGK